MHVATMPSHPGEPDADVLFNVDHATLNSPDGNRLPADMAAVIMLKPGLAMWPLEQIGRAMAVPWSYYLVPEIFAVIDDDGVAGYLAAPSGLLNQLKARDAYWRILHENTDGPTVDNGFVCEGLAAGQPVGITAYREPYKLRMPLAAINHAVEKLYTQPGWGDMPVFPCYPLRYGEGTTMYNGVLVAVEIPDFGANGLMDDVFVEDDILTPNKNRQYVSDNYPTLTPVRFAR